MRVKTRSNVSTGRFWFDAFFVSGADMSSDTAKPPEGEQPTALPCPPYAPFSWTAVVGFVEPAAKARLLHRSLVRPKKDNASAD
jgi:hypothetical protein